MGSPTTPPILLYYHPLGSPFIKVGDLGGGSIGGGTREFRVPPMC